MNIDKIISGLPSSCRYCGIPVVDADIRKLLHSLYPAAVPWVSSVPEWQHAAF